MSKIHSVKTDPALVGQRIKSLRLAAGLKQSAFVGEIISSGYISLIEQGKRAPSDRALEHIAKILGITVAELLEPKNQELSGKVRAQIATIELYLANFEITKAEELLNELEESLKRTLIGRILQVEIDYGLGNLMASELASTELIEDAIAAEDWQITRRAILTYGRIADRLNSQLESAMYLSQIRRRLLKIEDVDPLLVAQLTASLADRYMHLGDGASSMKLLAELDEVLPKVSDARGIGSAFWVKSNAAYAAGDYERAVNLANEALRYFGKESDPMPIAILQSLRFQILEHFLPEGDPKLDEVAAEIDEFLNSRTPDGTHLLADLLRVTRAGILVKMGDFQEALAIYEKALESLGADVQGEANIRSQIGQIYISVGNNERAEKYLAESLELLRGMEIDPSMRRQILILANRFEAVGNNKLAIETLKLAYKPVSDYAIILKD